MAISDISFDYGLRGMYKSVHVQEPTLRRVCRLREPVKSRTFISAVETAINEEYPDYEVEHITDNEQLTFAEKEDIDLGGYTIAATEKESYDRRTMLYRWPHKIEVNIPAAERVYGFGVSQEKNSVPYRWVSDDLTERLSQAIRDKL